MTSLSYASLLHCPMLSSVDPRWIPVSQNSFRGKWNVEQGEKLGDARIVRSAIHPAYSMIAVREWWRSDWVHHMCCTGTYLALCTHDAEAKTCDTWTSKACDVHMKSPDSHQESSSAWFGSQGSQQWDLHK